MRLNEELERAGGAQKASIAKYLNEAGVNEWGHLTKSGILRFRDLVTERLAPSSAKTICAALAAFLNRYDEEDIIPCASYAELLRLRGENCVKTFLEPDEIERLEQVACRNMRESFVLNEFLTACKTGARISDVREFTAENINAGVLTYTSKKTGVTASVPCSGRTAERIEWLKQNWMEVSLKVYNEVIRRLCKRAGIDGMVKVHKGGKDKTAPKYECISSHTARISFCTILSNVGVNLTDIAHLAGHTSTNMTYRYVVKTMPKLNEQALAILG